MTRVLWTIFGEKTVKSNIEPSREEIEKFLGTKMIESGKDGDRVRYEVEGILRKHKHWERDSELGEFFDKSMPIVLAYRGWTETRSEHPLISMCGIQKHKIALGLKVVLFQGVDLSVRVLVE